MFTIMIGNPIDGFEFFGQFTVREEAIETAAEKASQELDWWIIEIRPLEDMD